MPSEDQVLTDVQRLIEQVGTVPVSRCLSLVHLFKDIRETSLFALDTATFAATQSLGGLLWFKLPTKQRGHGATEIGFATSGIPTEIRSTQSA